ncbi:GAF domain-containing protein [Paracoccus liaowanqingii]|uniref:GAF domain-containing protein n=1 Tax=Paracoccus liaowanqingii TaxID=2560053 RepID=UPI00159BD8A0|nr:GAF domain-containing protein [Paracoccus liaowanqingii]
MFDRVVQTCKSLFNCEASLISLIDEKNDRQFFKAEAGLPESLAEKRETPLAYSFCKTVVAQSKPLVVFNAAIDVRFKDNPSVEEFGIMAYLGVPIKDRHGDAIAALCVIDIKARSWSTNDVDILAALGTGVSSQVQLMLALQTSKGFEEFNLNNDDVPQASELFPSALFQYFQHADGRETIDQVSSGCMRIWEVSEAEIMDSFGNIFAMCISDDLVGAYASLGHAAGSLVSWNHQWRIVTPSGHQKWLRGHGQPEMVPGGGIKWSALVQDITQVRENANFT